jgi:hypothetical protein
MKKYIGLVLAAEPDGVDTFFEEFRRLFPDIRIVYVKSSFDKLLIQSEQPHQEEG